MSAEVIPLSAAPSLMDTAAHLRRMADEIEAGEWGDNPTGIFLMPREDDFPVCFGWGPETSAAEVVYTLSQAVSFLTNSRVARG
jgi:hypothetical protein